jgi:hypothetical protein
MTFVYASVLLCNLLDTVFCLKILFVCVLSWIAMSCFECTIWVYIFQGKTCGMDVDSKKF